MKTGLLTLLTQGLLWLFIAGCAGDDEPPRQHGAVQRITGVETARASREEVAVTFATSGTLRPVTGSVLTSRIMGNVTAIRVREGDLVARGQTLVEIESQDIAAKVGQAEGALQAARAGLTHAQATFDRISALHARGSATPHELDGARMQLAAARGRVQQAEGALGEARSFEGFSRIEAPFTGVIARRMIEVGEQAAPGRPLLQMEGRNGMQFETQVPESVLAAIRIGQPVSVRIDVLGGKRLTGHVAEMEAAADPLSHSAKVKVDVEHVPGAVSGMSGKAEFVVGKRPVILVPAEAVFTRGQLTAVYVIDEQRRAHFRLVQRGKRFDARVEMLSGLNGGEEVAISQLDLLEDGAEIEG